MSHRTIPHVLLVDDEPGPLKALESSLRLKNPHWHISTVGDAASAIALLHEPDEVHGPVDVVLTDLVMHSDSEAGMKIIDAVKRYDPLTMVILFTAKEKEKQVNRFFALELGAFDCIEKNIVGKKADEEISLKANVALKFRDYALAEIENRRQIALLARYFDPLILDAVRNDTTLLEVKKRRITMIFWDIRGFSQLCEDLKEAPDLVHGFLTDYYNAAAEAIFRHGGILDKFIGDGVMAVFGALADRDEKDRAGIRKDAVNAAEAALSLRARFQEIVQHWIEEFKFVTAKSIEIFLGCGIHTGQALVGNFGIPSRDQFTAVGAHVNFTARVQHLAKHNQVLVSVTTKSTLPPEYEFKEVTVVNDIKGIPGQYVIYELVRNILAQPDLGVSVSQGSPSRPPAPS